MLNNDLKGADRLTDTLKSTVWTYNDSQLDAAAYMGRLTLATTAATQSRDNTHPNTIGASNSYHLYDAREGAWYTAYNGATTAGAWGGFQRVTDPAQIESLNDTRALRLEQQERAKDFHPQDPHRNIARSPRTVADAGPATQPENENALFERLTDAALAGDTNRMREASQTWRASAEGQQWLQSGKEHNASQREASHQDMLQVKAPQKPPQHEAPVMQL